MVEDLPAQAMEERVFQADPEEVLCCATRITDMEVRAGRLDTQVTGAAVVVLPSVEEAVWGCMDLVQADLEERLLIREAAAGAVVVRLEQQAISMPVARSVAAVAASEPPAAVAPSASSGDPGVRSRTTRRRSRRAESKNGRLIVVGGTRDHTPSDDRLIHSRTSSTEPRRLRRNR